MQAILVDNSVPPVIQVFKIRSNSTNSEQFLGDPMGELLFPIPPVRIKNKFQSIYAGEFQPNFSILEIEPSAVDLMCGSLKILAYEIVDLIGRVSELCQTPLLKVHVATLKESDPPERDLLVLTGIFYAAKHQAQGIWESLGKSMDSWMSNKSKEELDMIHSNILVDFDWKTE